MTERICPAGITIRHPNRIFIDGRWMPPASSTLIEVESPVSETIIARVAEGGRADMDAAVRSARQAFDEGPWPRMTPRDRAGYLMRMADALQRREPELEAAWTAQVGGLASLAPLMIAGATQNVRDTALLGETFDFEAPVASTVAAHALLVREAVGVVAAIAPWNIPYAIMIGKVAPALLAGCTVIMKPAPETPLEAYILAEIGEEVGLPPGVLNMVCGQREASDHLVCNPGVDKVSFTGSTAAGKRIASVCAERMARCTLELGGKSAAIVLDDFDIADAARLLTGTITMMSGQLCAMHSRVIISRSRHDALADAIAANMRAVRIGYPDDPQAMMGPIALRRQMERVMAYVDIGRQNADLVTGGGRPSHLNRGFFVEPTLFANVKSEARIAQEEIFGPVLSLIPCENADDAVRIANDSAYGLHGSVLTNDARAAYDIARRVRTGSIAQNGLRSDFKLPFGGFKQSGIGRENGPIGLASYTEIKVIYLDAPVAVG